MRAICSVNTSTGEYSSSLSIICNGFACYLYFNCMEFAMIVRKKVKAAIDKIFNMSKTNSSYEDIDSYLRIYITEYSNDDVDEAMDELCDQIMSGYISRDDVKCIQDYVQGCVDASEPCKIIEKFFRRDRSPEYLDGLAFIVNSRLKSLIYI